MSNWNPFNIYAQWQSEIMYTQNDANLDGFQKNAWKLNWLFVENSPGHPLSPSIEFNI